MVIAVVTCDREKFRRFKEEISESVGINENFKSRKPTEFTTRYNVTYKMIKNASETRSIAFHDYIVWDVPEVGANDIFEALNHKIHFFGYDRLI